MSFKAVLVSVDESPVLTSILDTAYLVSSRFAAYLEGYHVRPTLSAIVPGDGFAGGVPYQVETLEQDNIELARRAREAFDAYRQEKSLAWSKGTAPQDTCTVGWKEGASPENDIGSYGRLFDLVVVGRPGRDWAVPSMTVLESALFESGRPLLIAPPTAPKSIGDTILIAWNGSTESARAVGFAKPLLAEAKRVVVLTVEGAFVPGPSAAELAGYLARSGIQAEAREIPQDGRSPGAVILEEAVGVQADLIVKGAYTHSRLRQMIFGGATSHLLNEAEVPVFMTH